MADATDSAPVQWLASADALNDGSLSDDCVVILPLGATEQHGQHLPLETDTLIARGVCERLAEQLKTGNAGLYSAGGAGRLFPGTHGLCRQQDPEF